MSKKLATCIILIHIQTSNGQDIWATTPESETMVNQFCDVPPPTSTIHHYKCQDGNPKSQLLRLTSRYLNVDVGIKTFHNRTIFGKQVHRIDYKLSGKLRSPIEDGAYKRFLYNLQFHGLDKSIALTGLEYSDIEPSHCPNAIIGCKKTTVDVKNLGFKLNTFVIRDVENKTQTRIDFEVVVDIVQNPHGWQWHYLRKYLLGSTKVELRITDCAIYKEPKSAFPTLSNDCSIQLTYNSTNSILGRNMLEFTKTLNGFDIGFSGEYFSVDLTTLNKHAVSIETRIPSTNCKNTNFVLQTKMLRSAVSSIIPSKVASTNTAGGLNSASKDFSFAGNPYLCEIQNALANPTDCIMLATSWALSKIDVSTFGLAKFQVDGVRTSKKVRSSENIVVDTFKTVMKKGERLVKSCKFRIAGYRFGCSQVYACNA